MNVPVQARNIDHDGRLAKPANVTTIEGVRIRLHLAVELWRMQLTVPQRRKEVIRGSRRLLP